MREHIVPNETCGRIRECICAVEFHAIGVTAGKPCERALNIISDDSCIGPLMTISAENARAIDVVKQHGVTHERVEVWRDLFTKDAERWIESVWDALQEFKQTGYWPEFELGATNDN